MRAAAHASKGGAWIIGAMRLGQACAALEKDGAAGRLDDAWIGIGRIAVELELVSSAVRGAF